MNSRVTAQTRIPVVEVSTAPHRQEGVLPLTSNGAALDWVRWSQGSLKQSLKGRRRPMAMIREQNFSASSGGPFSCWLNSFSNRVRPADETRSWGGSTGRSPGSESPREAGRHSQGATPSPRLLTWQGAASQAERRLQSEAGGTAWDRAALVCSPVPPIPLTPEERGPRYGPSSSIWGGTLAFGSHWPPASSRCSPCCRLREGALSDHHLVRNVSGMAMGRDRNEETGRQASHPPGRKGESWPVKMLLRAGKREGKTQIFLMCSSEP